MAVISLGYWGIEASDPSGWHDLLVNTIGLTKTGKSDDGADVCSNDGYLSRVRIYHGDADDAKFVGWEVRGPMELAALCEKLDAAGCPVQPGGPALARTRCVEQVMLVKDPDDLQVELFWGGARAARPFGSTISPGGFVTGDDGVGHFVILARNAERTRHFYMDLLGLKLSDYIKVKQDDGSSIDVTFLHANTRHHSLAFAELPFKPKRKIQHISFQLREMSDIGFAFDRVLTKGLPIAQTMGHHPNCSTFSFYVRSPSGIDIELGWGSREVSDESWVPATYSQFSDWGHKMMLPPFERASA